MTQAPSTSRLSPTSVRSVYYPIGPRTVIRVGRENFFASEWVEEAAEKLSTGQVLRPSLAQ